MAGNHGGAAVLGAYIEGPYLSMAQKGALDPSFIRSPRGWHRGHLAGLR